MKKRVTTLAATAIVMAAALAPAALARVVDGIPDSWQARYDLSVDYNQDKFDPDSDALNNLNEYRANTSPRDADTDGNGVRDPDEDVDRDRLTNLQEQRQGTNPGDPDSNDDGIADDGGPLPPPPAATPPASPTPSPTGTETGTGTGTGTEDSEADDEEPADEEDEDDCHHDEDKDEDDKQDGKDGQAD
jgi:hypothetical protein